MSVLHDTSVSCKICINNNYLVQLNFHDCFEISLGMGFLGFAKITLGNGDGDRIINNENA